LQFWCVGVVVDEDSQAWLANREDIDWVTDQLGRVPKIPFRTVTRSVDGYPIVIELAPYDQDQTPQSNWFWLVERRLVSAVARLESQGGVRRAASSVDPGALDLANQSYRSGRHELPHMFGRGVGGARAGVKCLHAHVAFHLAGGFTPVGVWTMWWLYQSDRQLLTTLIGPV
jgi:hypothetical protein